MKFFASQSHATFPLDSFDSFLSLCSKSRVHIIYMFRRLWEKQLEAKLNSDKLFSLNIHPMLFLPCAVQKIELNYYCYTNILPISDRLGSRAFTNRKTNLHVEFLRKCKRLEVERAATARSPKTKWEWKQKSWHSHRAQTQRFN